MRVVERNVQEIGKSLLVTLPKNWTNTIGIKKGSRLKLLISEKGNLSIAPEFVEKPEHKQSVISYDQPFKRRFIREYFEGNEKITITFNKKTERKELYNYLKRFMNIQIIQESESKIVIKCFKIDELSMNECLNRMFYLSLNIIDEKINNNNKVKIQEIRDTMTRFYYMLVMQIRRFLSEGKFIAKDQISLLRAMDIRMVAEKIQRVGETIAQANIKDLKELKEYYTKSFNCFINKDFEKALPLYNQTNILKKKYEKNNQKELLLISKYIKQISMLVR